MIRQRKEGEEKDCPLSIDGWMMFLNGKINAIETRLYTLWAVIIAVLVALVGGSIAFTNSCIPVPIHGTTLDIPTGLILLPFAVVVYLFLLKYCKRTQKEVEPLETLRDDILTGLKDSNELLKRYLDAVGKSGEEKDLEKNVKEQKEVLQVPQGDIRDIKESLQEIKSILGKLERKKEETNVFNSFCVIGNVCTATGFAIIVAIMVMGAHFWDSSQYFWAILFALFWLSAGILMIKGADNIGTDLRKYLDTLDLKLVKELWHTNKWLFCSLLFLIFAILTLIVLLKSFV